LTGSGSDSTTLLNWKAIPVLYAEKGKQAWRQVLKKEKPVTTAR
jgi:hypothetical protein